MSKQLGLSREAEYLISDWMKDELMTAYVSRAIYQQVLAGIEEEKYIVEFTVTNERGSLSLKLNRTTAGDYRIEYE